MRLIAVLAVGAAATLSASCAFAQAPSPVSSMAPMGGDRSSAGWTAERMANAKPGEQLEINAATIDALKKRASMNRSAPIILNGSRGPRPPKPPPGGGGGGGGGTGSAYPEPLAYAGKLFYKTPDGGDYFCSAQLISPHVVLTAASCVQDGETGKWFTDFVFALQYKNGKSLAEFKDKCAATLSTWSKPRDNEDPYFFDYATILIDGESPVGHFGVAINWDSFDSATIVGYATGIADGQVAQALPGKLGDSDDGFVMVAHGRTERLGGIGGGAFVANYDDGTGGGGTGGGGTGGGGTGGGSGGGSTGGSGGSGGGSTGGSGGSGGGGATGGGGSTGGSGSGSGGGSGGSGAGGGSTETVTLGAPAMAPGGPGGADDRNIVISLDSFNYTNDPTVDYGPYLDDDFKLLWDYTENGCQ